MYCILIVSNSFDFFWVYKGCFVNRDTVRVFIMLVKLATLGLFTVKVFWNKDYNAMIYEVMGKFLSPDSSYIVNVIMWSKFGNSSISMREVTINSIS